MLLSQQLSLDFSCEDQVDYKTNRGFVVVARKNSSGFRPFSIPAAQIKSRIRALTKKFNSTKSDVWISQNTFCKTNTRKVEDLWELTKCYVDIDCYKVNLTAEQAYMQLEADYFRKSIPEPSWIIWSGQGLHLIWEIKHESLYSLPCWQSVQDYLTKTLSCLGSDPQSADAARILRVVNTVNQKNNAVVHAEVLHERNFTLTEIIEDYILPALPEPTLAPAPQKRKLSTEKINLWQTKKRKLLIRYNLAFDRMNDIAKLVELRKTVNPKTQAKQQKWGREYLLFLYRYFSCLYKKDADLALERTLELNSIFIYPLTEKEVIRATRSAEKMFLAQMNDELENNSQRNKEMKQLGYPGIGYNYTNAKLIKILDIQESEMQHMKTLISAKVKRDRKNNKRIVQGRSDRRGGNTACVSREQYLFECEEAVKDNVAKAKELRAQGMTQRQIAAELKVSVSTVNSYLKK